MNLQDALFDKRKEFTTIEFLTFLVKYSNSLVCDLLGMLKNIDYKQKDTESIMDNIMFIINKHNTEATMSEFFNNLDTEIDLNTDNLN